MNAHSVTCPQCSAVLKSTRPIPPGFKLKCPKCQQPFVSPKPEEDDEVVEPEFEDAAVQNGQTRKETALDRDTNLDDEPPPAAETDDEDLDELDELDEADDDDDPPAKKRARRARDDDDVEDDDLDDDEARPRKRRPARDDDDDDDEPRARKDKRSRDEDDEDADRPRKKKSKKKKKSKSNVGLFIGLAAGGGLLVIGAVVVIFLLVGGLGSSASQEAAARDMIGLMDELAGILEGVKDRNSAQAAGARIRDVASRFQKVVDRAKSLPNLTVEQDDELQKKLNPELNRAMQRMQQAAISAGFASGGEPSFVAALQELERVGRGISAIGRH